MLNRKLAIITLLMGTAVANVEQEGEVVEVEAESEAESEAEESEAEESEAEESEAEESAEDVHNYWRDGFGFAAGGCMTLYYLSEGQESAVGESKPVEGSRGRACEAAPAPAVATPTVIAGGAEGGAVESLDETTLVSLLKDFNESPAAQFFEIKGEKELVRPKDTKNGYHYFSQHLKAVVCRESDKWFYFADTKALGLKLMDLNPWKPCDSPPSGLLCEVSLCVKKKPTATPTVIAGGAAAPVAPPTPRTAVPGTSSVEGPYPSELPPVPPPSTDPKDERALARTGSNDSKAPAPPPAPLALTLPENVQEAGFEFTQSFAKSHLSRIFYSPQDKKYYKFTFNPHSPEYELVCELGLALPAYELVCELGPAFLTNFTDKVPKGPLHLLKVPEDVDKDGFFVDYGDDLSSLLDRELWCEYLQRYCKFDATKSKWLFFTDGTNWAEAPPNKEGRRYWNRPYGYVYFKKAKE